MCMTKEMKAQYINELYSRVKDDRKLDIGQLIIERYMQVRYKMIRMKGSGEDKKGKGVSKRKREEEESKMWEGGWCFGF